MEFEQQPGLKILKFESLVIQRISLLMYKYSTESVPPPIFGLFKKTNEVHTHFTRNSISLCTLRGKSEERYNTFSFKGVHIWNHISRNVNTYLIRLFNFFYKYICNRVIYPHSDEQSKC